MMGSGNQISSYASHAHEHTVTNCLHDKHSAGTKNGGATGGIPQAEVLENGKQETVSLKHMFTDGWKNVYSKTVNVIGKIWNDAGEQADGASAESKAVTDGSLVHAVAEEQLQQTAIQEMLNQINPAVMDKTAAETVSTTTTVNIQKDEEEEHRETQSVNAVESSVSGGLKKEQEGVRKFLNKLGKNVTKVGQFWKDERQEEVVLSANNTDYDMGDSSYLLDSYNRSGQYSTLAKDRSLEGNFRAKG